MKKMNLVFSALGLFFVFYIYGCKETVSDPNVDPNVVTIGNQVWMAKNLDVVTFRNGAQYQRLRLMMNGEQLVSKNNQLGVIMKTIQQIFKNMADYTIGMQLKIHGALNLLALEFQLMPNGLK